MENNVVKEEKVINLETEETKVEQTEERIIETEDDGTIGNELEPTKTFKEKFVDGCKTVGRGCKKAAKAAKPYVIGAAIGIGTACYAGLKIYKAVKNGNEGNAELGKSETPLLDMEYNPETDVTESEVAGEVIDESPEVDVSLDTEI